MIYVNGSPVHSTLFPDNTSQVWKVNQLDIPDTNWVHIKWEFSHEGEFMQLAQLKNLVDEMGFGCALRITYLPYGRQDKNISNSATFGLHTFATLLNSLNFDEVIIHDPHSSVALDLINSSRAVYPTKEVALIYERTNSDLICFPDKGAAIKYGEMFQLPQISADKVRDQLTGELLAYKLLGNCKDRTVLIVDDICDGGATFIGLSDLLRFNGAKEVNLFVSHGIFSKGLKPLFDSKINRIFTTDGEASEVQGHICYAKI